MQNAAIMAPWDKDPWESCAPRTRLTGQLRERVGGYGRQRIPGAVRKPKFQFSDRCHQQNVSELMPHPTRVARDAKRLSLCGCALYSVFAAHVSIGWLMRGGLAIEGPNPDLVVC